MNRRTFLATLPAVTLAPRLPGTEPDKNAVVATDWPWWRRPYS